MLLSTATNSTLRFNTPMQPYILICPPKPHSIDFWTTNFTHAATFSIKTHQCGMNFSLKSSYPILEFEPITLFKILAYLYLNFSHEHKHIQPQKYLCLTVKILYYFTTKLASKFMYIQQPKFVFPSLHFHHNFLAI